jgi:hypothetical protein
VMYHFVQVITDQLVHVRIIHGAWCPGYPADCSNYFLLRR